MSEVVLQIDGTNYKGWKGVAITLPLESIADSFELTLTDHWPSDNTPKPIRLGSPCVVMIDGEKVITGYVDDVIPEYDAKQHGLMVVGRSKTGDLVDCSVLDKTTFKGKTFLDVAKHICAPFSIEVSAGVDVGAPFSKAHSVEPGETAFEFLDRLARMRALRMVSTPEGGLLITRTSSERIGTPLVLGGNIKSASGNFSLRDRFSDYSVYGQQDTDDNLFGEVANDAFGTSNDKHVQRYRPTFIQADNITVDECKRQAQWHRNTRFGRSQAIVYTVLGWRHADGLWQRNRLVPIDDFYMGIKEDRLISTTRYLLDDEGERVEIEVMPPEAFNLVELPEGDDDSGGIWS